MYAPLGAQWYVRTEGYTVIETQPNPIRQFGLMPCVIAAVEMSVLLTAVWPTVLDVGQAIAVALGVIANVALIARFLERKPHLTTLVAIVGLTLHGQSLREAR